MDVEASLIRQENWPELKHYYATQKKHAWELGWLHLLKEEDFEKAIDCFLQSFQEPHTQEASFIMLWWLGKKSPLTFSFQSPSLRLYEAHATKNFSILLEYLEEHPNHFQFFPAVVERSIENVAERHLPHLEKFPRKASTSFSLGQHCDRHLKNERYAERFYKEFLDNPWIKKILEEFRHHLWEEQRTQKIREAYLHRDLLLLHQEIDHWLHRLKTENLPFSKEWKNAFQQAMQWEKDHGNEHFLHYPFWYEVELSPQALHQIFVQVFSSEANVEPPWWIHWKQFFNSQKLVPLPVTLDSHCLPLWQIRVELDPLCLQEALKRFPSEERFLFLWSLHSNQDEKVKNWLPLEKESRVVRKNLERAFEKSGNKILWFDRIRRSGCSQDFYEYALTKIKIPLSWILEDLEQQRLQATTIIRQSLKEQLSVETNSALLEEAFKFLTPLETQQVLLSQSLFSIVPEHLLNEERLNLLWEARLQVSEELFSQWVKAISHFLMQKKHSLQISRQWHWLEAALNQNVIFKIPAELPHSFPFDSFLQKLYEKGRYELCLEVLMKMDNLRIKSWWLEKLIPVSSDENLGLLIENFPEDMIRSSLLSSWYLKKGNLEKAIEWKERYLENCPILNEEVKIAEDLVSLYVQYLKLNTDFEKWNRILTLGEFLHKNGSLTFEICKNLYFICEHYAQWKESWRWGALTWWKASEEEKAATLPNILDKAIKGNCVEEGQRFLIDCIFQQSKATLSTSIILNILFQENSLFRIQHIRPEFIQQACLLLPLHPFVLQARAALDYRAVLLWECFYNSVLEVKAHLPSWDKKRLYNLWALTVSETQAEGLAPFCKYLILGTVSSLQEVSHEYFNRAKRLSRNLFKLYRTSEDIRIRITEQLVTPFRISFSPLTCDIQKEFFEKLDDDVWTALLTGVLQVSQDRNQGFFDTRKMVERFFQAQFLAGIPMKKLIRFWVLLALYERMTEPSLLQKSPEELGKQMPFLNTLLSFYLGSDFEQKMKECALVPQ